MNYFPKLTDREIRDITTSLRLNRRDTQKHLRILEEKKRKTKADKQMLEIGKKYHDRLYELEARLNNLIRGQDEI